MESVAHPALAPMPVDRKEKKFTSMKPHGQFMP